MHERARDLALRAIGRVVTTHPRTTIALSITLAAVCIVLTAQRLEFRSDRSDLVSERLEWNRRYADYKACFPRWNDLIVCIEGDPDDPRIDEMARGLAAHLRDRPSVDAAEAGFDTSDASPRLFRIDRDAEFTAHLARIDDARRLGACEGPNQALAVATAGMQASAGDPVDDPIGRLEQLLQPFLAVFIDEAPSFAWMSADAGTAGAGWKPFRSNSGRIRFIQVHLRDDVGGSIDSLGERLTELRAIIGDVIADSGIGDLRWGVTGIPAIEADETAQSIRDSTLASIVAFALITALMIIVFRGVTIPLLAAGSLVVAMAWSFGWLLASVGHLQLLSVVFTVILLGLGIDFALHLVARLELVQDEHDTLPDAMARVFGGIGPGLVTGAVTTAAAFGVVALTDFKGMAEMGIIAAGGVLLCLAAMCTVFPAAIALTGRWKSIIRHRPGGESAHFAWGRLNWVDPHPVAILVVAAAAVAGLGVAALGVRYDPNVLNLHAPGVESVRWEQRVVADSAVSVWAALARSDPQLAPELVARLRALPTVSEVGGMGSLFPATLATRRKVIADRRAQPPMVPAATAGPDALLAQLVALRVGLAHRLGEMTDVDRARAAVLLARLERTVTTAMGLGADERARRWDDLRRRFVAARRPLAAAVDTALDDRPLTAEDLPAALRDQWVGLDGSWLLQVYPTSDPAGRSILHPERLGAFCADLRSVDPAIFGPPIQIHESSELIIREYFKAACYAVAAILIVLLLDFRSLADTLCSLLPVSIGFVGAFGIMRILDAPLNFANIIVMPIIFGIGVDAGVHMVHRWRSDPQGRPAGLSGGTGRGISLTLTTTMIGFGCMLLAEHRGIRSLGLVMVAGLGVTLAACYTVLPAILQLRIRIAPVTPIDPR